jgi:hypothetical protein
MEYQVSDSNKRTSFKIEIIDQVRIKSYARSMRTLLLALN